MTIAERRTRAALLLRTVAHLRPAQVLHRTRLRALKVALAREPERLARRWRRPVPVEVGWPAGFAALDRSLVGGCPRPRDNHEGRFTFLAQPHDLGGATGPQTGIDWNPIGVSQLWSYHLHYFEWAWAFLADPDRAWAKTAFAQLFGSWERGTTFGRWDEWSPYVVSVRAWVLCDLFEPLVRGTEAQDRYVESLALHAGFVRHNLELDVGGNHLVKNLKALVGLGVLLHDDELVDVALTHLDRQLDVQVLADGGHFERSPSYHAQVLGDLIDIAELGRATRRDTPPALESALTAMREWLGSMLSPDGSVPLVNDAVPVSAERLEAFGVVRRVELQPLTVLDPSGYIVVEPDPHLHLLLDVGPPCPDTLPAHAHADCLSFEMHIDGTPVVVDTATSTYSPGERRCYERSTAAHSTVEVDAEDQTEVWGTFRAARLARPALEAATRHGEVIEVAASHDGYERLAHPVRHRRTWEIRPGEVTIVDQLEGEDAHEVCWTLVLAPEVTVTADAGAWLLGPHDLRVEPPGPGSAVDDVEVARGFGRLERSRAIRWRTATTLPATLEARLSLPETPLNTEGADN